MTATCSISVEERLSRWIVQHLVPILAEENRLKLPRSRFRVTPPVIGELTGTILRQGTIEYVPPTDLELLVDSYLPSH